MDGQWHRPWEPTIADYNKELLTRYAKPYCYLQRPSSKETQQLKAELQRLTLLLQWGDQSAWLKRGRALLNLQYPELAAGDLYYALQVSEGRNRDATLLLLAQALFLVNSFLECIQILERASSDSSELRRLKTYAQKSFDKENEEHSGPRTVDQDMSGEVVTRAYPWIKPTWLLRQSKVLEAVNERLCSTSASQCEVRRSAISDTTQDCFGIFATAAIPKGTHLFTDTTALCATSGLSKRCGCCGGKLAWSAHQLLCCNDPESFCSGVCLDRAYATYHKALYGQIINDSFATTDSVAAVPDHEANDRLWLRILTSIKQALDEHGPSYEHPLEIPAVNQLSVRHDTVVRFSLRRDIVEPRRALRKLGISNLDLRFDTWVLRTIAGRVENNVRHCIIDTEHTVLEREECLLAINRTYAFFNHSCQPNVEVNIDIEGQNSAVHFKAKRSLHKGEELYISYLFEDELEAGHEERAELLKPWTGGVCNCIRCWEERAVPNEDEDNDDDYQPDDCGQSESSSGDESV